jgi:hypothetical protein
VIVLGAFLALLLPPPATHAAAGRAEPRVSLSLAPANGPAEASVQPGDMLRLDVRIDNVGEADAHDLAVRFIYRPELILVQESTVDTVDPHSFTVYFGTQGAGTFNTRQVTLMVRPEVQPPAQVVVQAQIGWWDQRGGYTIPGPSVALVVGQGGDSTTASTSPVDRDLPVSSISCLRLDGTGAQVGWAGQDATSSVRGYHVQARQLPNGYWRTWKDTGDLQDWFGPLEGKTFAFRVQAVDAWGNLGNWSDEVSMEGLQSGAVLRQYRRCPRRPTGSSASRASREGLGVY